MIDNKIVFQKVDEQLNVDYIYRLGKEYCQTFDDKPIFIIKTRHIEDETKIIDNKFVSTPITVVDILIMNVFKCSNGYISTINGHMGSDYNGYEIYEIAKISF